MTTYPNAAELLIRLGVSDRIVGSMYHNDTTVTAEVADSFAKLSQQFAKYPQRKSLSTSGLILHWQPTMPLILAVRMGCLRQKKQRHWEHRCMVSALNVAVELLRRLNSA